MQCKSLEIVVYCFGLFFVDKIYSWFDAMIQRIT